MMRKVDLRNTGKYCRSFSVACGLCAVAVCTAQTDAQFSQYYEAPSFYNPAAIGLTDFVRIRAGARLQWVGVDNAPQTFAGVADMPVIDNEAYICTTCRSKLPRSASAWA